MYSSVKKILRISIFSVLLALVGTVMCNSNSVYAYVTDGIPNTSEFGVNLKLTSSDAIYLSSGGVLNEEKSHLSEEEINGLYDEMRHNNYFLARIPIDLSNMIFVRGVKNDTPANDIEEFIEKGYVDEITKGLESNGATINSLHQTTVADKRYVEIDLITPNGNGSMMYMTLFDGNLISYNYVGDAGTSIETKRSAVTSFIREIVYNNSSSPDMDVKQTVSYSLAERKKRDIIFAIIVVLIVSAALILITRISNNRKNSADEKSRKQLKNNYKKSSEYVVLNTSPNKDDIYLILESLIDQWKKVYPNSGISFSGNTERDVKEIIKHDLSTSNKNALSDKMMELFALLHI